MKNARITILMVIWITIVGRGFCAIEFKDGETHNINYQINTEVWVDYSTPSMQTTMNFITGGSMNTDRDLYAYEDSQINILGGSLKGILYAMNRTQVTASKGKIGRYLFLYDTSHASLNGGYIDSYLHTYGNSEAIIYEASLGQGLVAHDNSTIYIYGGSIGSFEFQVLDTSHVYLSGCNISSSSTFQISSVLTIKGTNFAVDGSPVGYGEITSINGGSWSDDPLRNLTGTLFNGDLLNNAFYIGGTGKIVLAPPPTYVLTMDIEPTGIGIDTVSPTVGNHNIEGWCNISANKYINCPDVYLFDHWDGDVADPNSANTTVFMDSDKTVTAVFTATRECGDECHPNDLFGDYNHDCIIDLRDFAYFAENWLVCTKPECD